MNYNPVGRLFEEQTTIGVDANANSVTVALDISNAISVFIEILDNTGTHATHIVTLQCSADGTNWNDTTTTITGLGFVNDIPVSTKFVRAKVSTVEGGVSTIDINIQAK